MEAEIVQGKVTIIIGVPGPWTDRSAIIRAVTTSNINVLLMVGKALIHLPTKHGFEFDIFPHDPHMGLAFAAAGGQWVTEADLALIDSHQQTVYLLGPGGNLDNAREMMQITNGLINAGGFAVKVETAGKAFRGADWASMCQGQGPLVLYDAYVVFGIGTNTAYSCGMHNLGYHDAIVSSDLEPDEAVSLLDSFLKYLLVEQPVISEGQTFALSPEAPAYRLSLEPCTLYPADDLFYNPFGMWRLTPEAR